MTIDLDAIRARCEAATPGPWENCRGFVRSTACGSEMEAPGFRVSTSTLWVAECRDGEAFYNPDGNAAFIAHARTDVPALLAEIAGLRKALGEFAMRCDDRAVNAERIQERWTPGPDGNNQTIAYWRGRQTEAVEIAAIIRAHLAALSAEEKQK